MLGCLLPLLLAAGCASERINLWPIYYQAPERIEGTDGQTKMVREALGPIFSWETRKGRHYHAVRPFYNYEWNARKGLSRLQYLWPLGVFYRREGDVWQHRLLPIFSHHELQEKSTGRERANGFLLPFFFWGRRPQGGYFAVFPVGGLLRGVLGDSFSFVLFPLFSRYVRGDYTRYDVLWPVFSWGSTPDGEETTFRAWPFYVHYRREGLYDQRHVLWPLVQWGTLNSRGRYPQELLRVFPFYSSRVASDSEGNVVKYWKQVLFVSWEQDTRPEHRSSGWSLFWYLLRFSRGPKSEEALVFPLYWRKSLYADDSRNPDRAWTRYRVLWPILWFDYNGLDPEVDRRSFVVAPIYWDYASTYHGPQDDEKSRSVTLWPLMTWKSDRQDALHFWLPSHGWEDAPEGYKRNYRRFLEVFQYHSGPGDRLRIAFLWRAFRYVTGPEGTDWNVLSLLSYWSDREDEKVKRKEVSVLFGLLKYIREKGESRWRVLYIPL